MSKLTETQVAFDKLASLLDQEIRSRSGNVKELEKIREALNVAFYLLGWSQFEHLVREEASAEVDRRATTHLLERHAWEFMRDNIKTLTVRKRLALIFHNDRATRLSLDRDYTVRNEAAHNYKQLPNDAKDVSTWIAKLEGLVDKF